MKKIILFALAIISLSFTHDYHVAISAVTSNNTNKSLEITQKIFLEDLEKAILEENKVKLYIGTDKQHSNCKELIGDYIKNHLILSIEGKKQNLNYLGFEQENELIFAYFETPKIAKLKSISIVNTILLDTFSDQANIMHFKVNEQKQTLYFNINNSKETISFKAFTPK